MSFYEELQRAQDEASEVQPAYRKALVDSLAKTNNYDISVIPPKGKEDVLIPAIYYDGDVANNFLIIIECKLDQSLRNDKFRADVILQVICYLKQRKLNGEVIPRVALIGTKYELFTLPTSCLQSYIGKDIVGYNSASTAYVKNLSIIKEIIQDDEIQKFCQIEEITKDFNIELLKNEILTLAKENKYKLEIEENSISKVFDYFSKFVLKDRVVYDGCKQSLPPRIQKDLFMMMLLNPDDCYLHPNKKDTAIFGIGNERSVNRSAYLAFKNAYEFTYNRDEKKKFTEICDRLIEDAERRNKGDFYTPTLWADEAHKLISKELGEDWKKNYIVWDCCCGTKNLTRDYKFGELYSSTIDEGDIRIGEKYNLNVEGSHNVAFIYDFLNDDVDMFEELLNRKNNGEKLTEQNFIDSKLYFQAPNLIRSLLMGKPLVFLINPPYATTGDMHLKGNKDKGLSDTRINMLMSDMGGCQQQLYAQFIFRIARIARLFDALVYMGIFCPTNMFCGKHFKKLHEQYLKNYISGFYFQASQFADVASDWAIAFSLWSFEDKSNTTYILNALKNNMGNVDIVRENKRIYSAEKHSILDIFSKEKKSETIPVFTMSSGLCVTDKIYNQPKNSLGYLFMDTPRVGYNTRFVTLINRKMKGNKIAISLSEDNFELACLVYSIRKLISGTYSNWVNNADEYINPQLESSNQVYQSFKNDCLVYAIFHDVNNCTSLRNVQDPNGVSNLKNEFFFMSEKEVADLALGKNGKEDINDKVVEDAENFGGNRFIYKKLCEIKLSEDAQAVLDKARELVRLSFKERELFNYDHPEYQINTWDAGWYQIKALLKEYHPDELNEFNKLYKAFEDRMRPLVYELGFLYK